MMLADWLRMRHGQGQNRHSALTVKLGKGFVLRRGPCDIGVDLEINMINVGGFECVFKRIQVRWRAKMKL